MKRVVILGNLALLLVLASCKTTSNSTSKPKDFVAANGRKKVLFEGYNDNSKQYVNRVCIAPTFALNNKTVRPEYLMPEIFSLVPDTEVGKILKTINDSAKALGVAMDPMKINSYSGSDQEASIEYIKDAEGTTLLDKVAGGLNVSMNFAGGSASGGAQIALENGKTSRSLSQMFLLKLRGQSVQIDPQTVSAAWGLTAYGESVRDSVSKILGDDAQVQYVAQHCGTSYISSVQFGATFLASLKIIGKMESDLTYIQGQLNVKTVGASGGGQVEIDNKKISSNMKVNLNIYQKGGEPVSLAGIFNGGGFDANGTANTLARDTTSSKLVNCDVGTLSNCLDVFFRIVEYGTGGLPIDVNGDPKVGTKTGISPKLAAQISDVTRSGYSVIGYEKERYYVEDFVTAGMFTNPPAGMQLRARAAPKKSSMGFKLAQAAANKKPMPLSSRTLQKSLEMRLRSIINIWAYASESRQIVNDLTHRLNLAEVEAELLSTISNIQAVFEQCGAGEVAICEAKTKETLSTLEDPAKSIAFVGLVNKIIEEELKTANFYDYCMLTGVRRFQDGKETDWRNSMQLLATRILSPDMKIEGQSILDWRLDSDNASKILAAGNDAPADANASGKLGKLSEFCEALYNAPQTSTLDFTYTGSENKSLLVEPLKYFKGIQTLKITGGSVTSDIVSNVAFLPDLRNLTVRNATISNPIGFSQMPFLQVLNLEGVQTSQQVKVGEQTYFASTLREALRNPNLTRIVITQNRDIPTDAFVDLEEFPLLYAKGVFANRIIYQVAVQDNQQISLGHVERFFGFEDDGEKCVSKYPVKTVASWAGREELELNINRWDDIFYTNCLKEVQERCLQIKKTLKKSTNLVCETAT